MSSEKRDIDFWVAEVEKEIESLHHFIGLLKVMKKYCNIDLNTDTGKFTTIPRKGLSAQEEEIVRKVQLLFDKKERYDWFSKHEGQFTRRKNKNP